MAAAREDVAGKPPKPPLSWRLRAFWRAHVFGRETALPAGSAPGAEDGEPLPVDPRAAFGQPPRGRPFDWRPVTAREANTLHERPDAFLDLLPWIDYLPDSQAVLLEDGHSLGALFELQAVSAEARSADWFSDLHRRLEAALCNAVTETDPPWILQIYLQDDPNPPRDLPETLLDYARRHVPERCPNAVTEALATALQGHLATACRPQGLFVDQHVTGVPWRCQQRTLRAMLYRRTPDTSPHAATELTEVAQRFAASLEALGIGTRRCDGDDLYDWLMPWFSPAPAWADNDPYQVLRRCTRPSFGPPSGERPRRPFVLPWGRDLAQWLVNSQPLSDYASRTWWFDGRPHAFVSVQRLDREPEIGLLSAERRQGQHTYALFDRLPQGSIFCMTIEVRPQDEVKQHLNRLVNGSRAGSAEAEQTHHDALAALRLLGRGHKLYPCALGVYLCGETAEQISERRLRAEALLAAHGLMPIQAAGDLLGLDSYLRFLPGNFLPHHDRRARRSYLQFSYDLASLLPLYGRARGTGHGIAFWNRGGEPLQFDPLNKDDRTKNAHLLLLGPTGAGKSAQLVYLVLTMLALHRPRVFLIEAGNSFGLLMDWLRSAGLDTHSVRIQPSSPVSLCPYLFAQHLLAQPQVLSESEENLPEALDEESVGDDDNRDLLGEMELAARIMITGGEEKEDAKLTRADRFKIRASIVLAAQLSRDAGREQTLTRDVVAALRQISRDDDTLGVRQRERLNEMADAMALFTQGVEGSFFDRAGDAWPVRDVTHIDLGHYAREGNADKLVVTMVGLFYRINDLAERGQHEARQGLVIVDEAHILTTNPLLAPFLAKITKMWRKLGYWLWLATQNLQDFPDTAKKLLNMIEWWLLLVMPKEEVNELTRFRSLTSEQRELLLSATKSPGQYVEGVVLADRVQALFRSVLPGIALALAQTEKHEKAERARLMREHGVDELGAAELVAQAIDAARREVS